MTSANELDGPSSLGVLGQQLARSNATDNILPVAHTAPLAAGAANEPLPAIPNPVPNHAAFSAAEQQGLAQAEMDAAFETDEDEVEGDTETDEDGPDGEVKTSVRWKDDMASEAPQNPAYVCPHPKCPSNKKPSAHQFKKRKEHPVVEPERKTRWGRYLFKFKTDHPAMDSHTAKVEARKAYIPESGKKKSFQRIFAEKWKANNPLWREIKDPKELDAKIRDAFLAQV